jgi:hypothetical protein
MSAPRDAAFDAWIDTKDGCQSLDSHRRAFRAGYNAGCAAARLTLEAKVLEATDVLGKPLSCPLCGDPRSIGVDHWCKQYPPKRWSDL